MFCQKCGNQVADGDAVCTQCGNRLDQQEAPAQTQSLGMAPAVAPQGDAPMSKDDYKAAKNAYKQARKAAGKTRKPLVIGVIIAILVVAGLAAGVTWYLMSQQQPSETQAVVVEGNAADSTDASVPYAEYIGVWEGELNSTKGEFGVHCYGGENSDLTFDIQTIAQSGRLKASAEVVYHGHEALSDGNDVDSSSGDAKMSFENMTGTFESNGFELECDVNRNGDYVEFKVVPTQRAGKEELEVTVTSYFSNSRVEQDTYILTKKN